jgi:hypothetical protein
VVREYGSATGESIDRIDGDPRAEGDLVIGLTGTVCVMVATKPVDFHKGMEGLAALVREAMGADPFCVFRAKCADRVKLIFWRTVVIHLLCDHAR